MRPSTPSIKPSFKPSTPSVKPSFKPHTSAPRPVSSPIKTGITTPRPIAKPISTPKPILGSRPTQKPISTPKPSHKPTANPTQKPVHKPIANPISKPAHKPITNPIQKPAARPIANPTHKPVNQTPRPQPVASKPNPGAHTPTNVYQANPAWKNMKLGNGQTTIGKGGCAISSLAAMAEKAGIKINGAAPNTLNMNNWLKENGGFAKGSSLVNMSAMSKLGFKAGEKISGNNMQSTIQQGMSQGKSVILNVGGHYVYATGKDATGYIVVDPGHQYRNHYTFDQIKSARLFTR